MAENAANSNPVYRTGTNKTNKTGFPRWHCAGFTSELLPIVPPGAPISPKSETLTPKILGKTPGLRRESGWVGLGGKWSTEFFAKLPDVQAWHNMGASVGLQTRKFVAIDVDIDDKKLSREIEKLAYDKLGAAPRRIRTGSQRCLLLYRLKDGETPLRKRRLAFLIGDAKAAVEMLGLGQQCVVEGPHPAGGEYTWPDWHPCDTGPASLTEITAATADAFFAALADTLEMYGYKFAAEQSSSSGGGTRKGLDNPALHAPSPDMVLDALKVWRPEHMGHDEYVQALVAIKASLGPSREDYRQEVLEWSPGVRSGEDDQFAARWDSINDSTLGWSFVEGMARKAGYRGSAQHTFADTPQADNPQAAPAGVSAVDPENPDGSIPENALDRMVARFVYCTELDRYFDTTTRAFISEKSVNVCSTDVAAYGKTGTNSAAAQLQNHPKAQRVATPTYRPGKPMLIAEAGKPAVKTWRPSNVVPAKDVADADVKPWLTLCDVLFGNATPEREHFLNWWAYNFQKPGRKIGHAIALISGQGFGKDTLLKPLFKGLGTHNVASIDTTALANSFNFYLRFQIVYVQEAKMGGRHRDLYNYLKPFISAQATGLAVNEKNLPQYFLPNNQNWLVTSNHDNALALEDDDRRFWAHRAVAEEAPSDDFFTKLHAWYKAGGVEKIAGWLLQRDLSGFNPMAKPGSTAAKRAMLELSQPAPVLWLREKLMAGGSLADRRVVTVRELRNRGREWDAPEPPTERHVTAALKAEGFKAAHRVRLGNDVDRLWARGVHGSTTADAMRALYRSETEDPSCKAA